ncbi:MAG: tRNA-dihydrouridine synthase family protein [Bacteroidales bacterium]|nr:tRNA-dihydrouridine synthase family protein [Bacteroidales bacterium]
MPCPYLAFAPLQGYTDAVYRRAHHACCGGIDEYYTPFVRLEHGAPRRRDLRDVAPSACAGVPTVPQVIARDSDEFATLCDTLQKLGWLRIDLNLGCPFPLQTHAGRGSGLLQHPDRLEAICREMTHRPELAFSVKMRLGQASVDEGLAAVDILNAAPLVHVTLHPRLGRQQYKGAPDLDAFARFYESTGHPMVYNGDLADPAQIGILRRRFPRLKGFMLGRGLLARPSLLGGPGHDESLRLLHAEVYRHAASTLCGDSQILARLHSFWDYPDIDPKVRKTLLKASSLTRYREALRPLGIIL